MCGFFCGPRQSGSGVILNNPAFSIELLYKRYKIILFNLYFRGFLLKMAKKERSKIMILKLLISCSIGLVFSMQAQAQTCSYLIGHGVSDTFSTASFNMDFGDVDYTVMMNRSKADVIGDSNCIFIRGTVNPLGDKQRWFSYYGFFYSQEGFFSIWKKVSGGAVEQFLPGGGWMSDSIINQGDAWNKLRVVATGNSLSYYINDKLVWSGTDSSLSSGRVGLGMFSSTGLTSNELLVDWATLAGGFDSQFNCSAEGWVNHSGYWNLYTLSISKSGTGTGTVTGTGINCGTDCNEPFYVGTQVSLTAAIGADSEFTGWSGACSGTNNPCTVTMSANVAVTATFAATGTPQGPYTLSISKSGTGTGTVTGPGISCGTDCSEPFTAGTQVSLTAAGDAGSLFTGWSGACSGATNPCAVTMDANKAVTPGFDITYRLYLPLIQKK